MQFNHEKKTQAEEPFNKLLKIFKTAILITNMIFPPPHLPKRLTEKLFQESVEVISNGRANMAFYKKKRVTVKLLNDPSNDLLKIIF